MEHAMSVDHDRNEPKVDPLQVIELYDQGLFPSQVSVQLNISLNEVIDILEKRRKESLYNDDDSLVTD
jgi:hypothetical protein